MVKNPPKTMPVEQAAKILQIGRNAAYSAVARGEIPHIRIGKRILVLADPLDRMLAGEALQPAKTR
jgi:excisionase family DNA binding protein